MAYKRTYTEEDLKKLDYAGLKKLFKGLKSGYRIKIRFQGSEKISEAVVHRFQLSQPATVLTTDEKGKDRFIHLTDIVEVRR